MSPRVGVDADDIADLAVTALTADGPAGRVYEATGPRLTFAEVVEEVAAAARRRIQFVPISPDRFAAQLAERRVSPDLGRALGREPTDFADCARAAAATGVWRVRR
jgi:uncharacterized protein YbjT (DUF2867 family)